MRVWVTVLGEKHLQSNQSLQNLCLRDCKAAALALMWANYTEDADVGNLRRSTPQHPVRCLVMASLGIKSSNFFPGKDTLKPQYRPTP